MIPTWPVSQGFLRIKGAGEMDALGALEAGGSVKNLVQTPAPLDQVCLSD